MTENSRATPWHARPEAGVGVGIRIVEAVAILFGRRVVHLFVAPIAAYFMLTRGEERRASFGFLSRVLGRRVRTIDVFRHFHTFAMITVDRVFLQSRFRHRVPMQVTGQEQIEETLRQGRACILLSAHFGSFEATRQAGLSNPALRLRIILDRTVNLRMIRRLEQIDPAFAAGILDSREDALVLTLKIGDCLHAGEWIGWLGDRFRAGERTIAVEFLGKNARFPASPFIVARLFRVPVFMVLATFEDRGYKVIVEQIVNDIDLDAPERGSFASEKAAMFADRLGHHVRRAPFNWFNFYDFWNT